MSIIEDRNRIKELEKEIEFLKLTRKETLSHNIGPYRVTKSQHDFVTRLAIDNIGWDNMSGGLRLAIDIAMERY